jgi:lipoic acid synthetase
VPDPGEADNILNTVRELGLIFVVITSVSRDDLVDGGAGQFFEVVRCLKDYEPNITVEVLVPDFEGRNESIRQVLDACPDVFAHNVETVPRLYPRVRPQADYRRSLRVLSSVKRFDRSIVVKSSILVGLGETEEEILQVMRDLHEEGVDALTVGQYLAPSNEHYPVKEFISPGQFIRFREAGLTMGFKAVQSGPLVRSSYRACESYNEVKKCMI